MKLLNHIKGFLHSIRARLATLHEQLIVTDERQLDQPPKTRNAYQVFRDWCLEIAGYGILITFVLNAWVGWFGWQNLALVPANGIALWLCQDIIRIVKEALSKE
jgi:hypothetical protein